LGEAIVFRVIGCRVEIFALGGTGYKKRLGDFRLDQNEPLLSRKVRLSRLIGSRGKNRVPWADKKIAVTRRIDQRTWSGCTYWAASVSHLWILFGPVLQQRFDLRNMELRATPRGLALVKRGTFRVISQVAIDGQSRPLVDGRPLKVDGEDVVVRGGNYYYLPAEKLFRGLGPGPAADSTRP
jgi:hypothetical protein